MCFDETLEQQEAGTSDTPCAYSLVPDHKTVLTRERAVCVCVCVHASLKQEKKFISVLTGANQKSN